MTPEEALPFIAEEGKRPPSLDVLLGYLGLEEDEFNEIVRGMEVSPYHHDPKTTGDATATWDQELMYRDDGGRGSGTGPGLDLNSALEERARRRPAATRR